jgi:hypothetical protein
LSCGVRPLPRPETAPAPTHARCQSSAAGTAQPPPLGAFRLRHRRVRPRMERVRFAVHLRVQARRTQDRVHRGRDILDTTRDSLHHRPARGLWPLRGVLSSYPRISSVRRSRPKGISHALSAGNDIHR